MIIASPIIACCCFQ